MDLLITGGTLLTPSGECRADVAVHGGEIALIGADLSHIRAIRKLGAEGKMVLPGLIDTHLGLWEPRPEKFTQATRAAALGGVTASMISVICPRGQDPQELLDAARRVYDGKSAIDWGMHLALDGTPPVGTMLGAMRSHGVTTLQFSLADGNPDQEMGDAEAMAVLQEIAGHALAMVHCENGELIRHLLLNPPNGSSARGGLAYALARPTWLEAEAIARMATLADATGANVLVTAVSSQRALAALERAKGSGAPILGQAGIHHLALTDDLLTEDEAHLWCTAPPLRPKGNDHSLWRALDSGLLDSVASHHRAVPREAKRPGQADAQRCVPGLPSIETLLPTLWSEGIERRRLTRQALVAVACEMPAKLLGLYPRKGCLEIGSDADLVIVDPDQTRTVDPKRLHMGGNLHPQAEKSLRGWPVATVLGGEVIAENGVMTGSEATGAYLERKHSLP
jgi:dihydropyrimidinase